MTRRTIGILALPYGAAAALVLVAWLAGGIGGAETTFGAHAWATIGLLLSACLAFLAFVGWLAAVILAVRRLRLLALITAPSVVLVVLTATGIPLIMGACVVARACI